MSISFIKLDINILNDSKIKIVRKLPDGDKLFLLWVGMLCLAMKSARPGVLEISDGLPYNDELLAGELDLELNVVRLGLDWFVKLKMIELLENGEVFLINFSSHQALEKIEKKREQARLRKQRQRERISNSSQSHADVTGESRRCHADVTRDNSVSHADVTQASANVTQQTKTKTKTKTKTRLNYIPATPAEVDGKPQGEEEKIFPKNKTDPEIKEFCQKFYETVKQRHGRKAPRNPKLSVWEEEVEKLIRLDGFSLEEIKDAVRWGVIDSFWSPNILSLGELRKKRPGNDLSKFQKLMASYIASTQGRNPPGQKGKANLMSFVVSRLEELEGEKGGKFG